MSNKDLCKSCIQMVNSRCKAPKNRDQFIGLYRGEFITTACSYYEKWLKDGFTKDFKKKVKWPKEEVS